MPAWFGNVNKARPLVIVTAAMLVIGIFTISLMMFADDQHASGWRPDTTKLLALGGMTIALVGLLMPATLRVLQYWHWKRNYLHKVLFRNRFLGVGGLTTPNIFKSDVTRVFVDLKIGTQHRRNVRRGLLDDPSPFDPQSIWYFLANQAEFLRYLAIVGPPGSGKTTLLQHVAVELANGRHRHYKSQWLGFVLMRLPWLRWPFGFLDERRCRRMLPVLLLLRDHREALSAKVPPTLARITYLREAQHGVCPPESWFERALQKGRCLVMMDGFDEALGDADRAAIARWVDRQIERYPNNRFIVTSRPYGYESAPLERSHLLEVEPFSPAQTKAFVESWYLSNEVMRAGCDDRGVRQKAMSQSADLLQAIRNSVALTQFAVNPLLLTMVATVHCFRGKLPHRRVELYSEICEVLLGSWQLARGIPDVYTHDQKRAVLQPLAFYMMCEGIREITTADAMEFIELPLSHLARRGGTSSEFLTNVLTRSGLLVEKEAGVLSFAHFTLQEYLASSHVADRGDERVLLEGLLDPWWQETIRLYVGQRDASNVIRKLLDLAKYRTPDESKYALMLGHMCLADARNVDPDAVWALRSHLIGQIESSDSGIAKLGADVLLMLRLAGLFRVDTDREIDPSFISCAEYRLFVSDRLSSGEYRQPDHWRHSTFPEGAALRPVTGIRAADAVAFCAWLTSRLNSAGRRIEVIRLPNLEEAAARLQLAKNVDSLFSELAAADLRCWTIEGDFAERPSDSPADDEISKAWHAVRDDVDFIRSIGIPIDIDDNDWVVRLKAHILDTSQDVGRAVPDEFALQSDLDTYFTKSVQAAFTGTATSADWLESTLQLLQESSGTLSHALVRIRRTTRNRQFVETPDVDSVPLLRLSRVSHLLLATLARQQATEQRRKSTGFLAADHRERQEANLRAYGALLRLQLRVEGVLVAREGLSIVRERTSDDLAPTAQLVRRQKVYPRLKPVLDRLMAALLLVPSLPVLAFLIALIRLTSRGPAIFRQERVGRNGVSFEIFKLRTMRLDAEFDTGPAWSARHDPRVTVLGRILRLTHLDELPLLVNVLRGDMSLIGPRPELPQFVSSLPEQIDGYMDRLSVRPGITGLAQINRPDISDLDSARRELVLDLEYIENSSFFMDLRIMMCTSLRTIGMRGYFAAEILGVARPIQIKPTHQDDAPKR